MSTTDAPSTSKTSSKSSSSSTSSDAIALPILDAANEVGYLGTVPDDDTDYTLSGVTSSK